MKVIFDVLHLYYLPQYLPVASELSKHDVDVTYLFYRNSDPALQAVCEKVVADEALKVIWVDDWPEALSAYRSTKCDWIFFGNTIKDIEQVNEVSKTVMMGHGIGPKSCYYEVSECVTTVRFVEGQHRLDRLQNTYPANNFVDTGYAKLDAAINAKSEDFTLGKLGLDPNKKTILYAPTFYPSSIEKFSKKFPADFNAYNVIVKPHFFSLTKSKYKKQRAQMEKWQNASNVYLANVEDYNLIPFMALSDVMLSDASSAIFEFAALGKPVVWCDFYQLRWSYRGPFKFRFKNRLDGDIGYFEKVAFQAKSYKDVMALTNKALDSGVPNESHKVIEQLAGKVDGKCSQRIASYLLNH